MADGSTLNKVVAHILKSRTREVPAPKLAPENDASVDFLAHDPRYMGPGFGPEMDAPAERKKPAKKEKKAPQEPVNTRPILP